VSFISDPVARAHLRISTGEDDGNLLVYVVGAEQIA